MTIKGSLQLSIPIVKGFLRLSKIGEKFTFWGKMMSKCVFGTPKRHILARNRVI